jgi:hypothetical protein
MVNRRFQTKIPHGFEMVAGARLVGPREAASIENLQRIHSVAFFTNCPRIKLNAITCDISRVVSEAPIA